MPVKILLSITLFLSLVLCVHIFASGETDIPEIDKSSFIPLAVLSESESIRAVSEKGLPEMPEPEYISLGEFILTAYCSCVKCCGVWSMEHPSRIGTDYVQTTASGTIPNTNKTIGVDPKIISLGSTVIIGGHEYTAEDKGGNIKGNRIDIFFNTHLEAIEFGRQTAEIYIKNFN